MFAEFPHTIEFANQGEVSVKDIAASLLANEQILISTGRVLENIIPGLHVEKINVRFISASTNSPLKEAFAAGILVAYQKDLTRQIPKLIEDWTGVHVSDQYSTIVTIIVLATALYGIEQAWHLFKKKVSQDKVDAALPVIQGNFNNVVHVGGSVLGVSPEQIARAIASSFDRKQRLALARQSISFIKPAKKDNAAIRGGDVTIEGESVAAAPSDMDVDLEEDRAPPQTLIKQRIVIHATDKDHAKSGWAGHIPDFWEKRVPMKLFPGVPLDQLFGKEAVEADMTIVFKKDDDGQDIPETIHILRVY